MTLGYTPACTDRMHTASGALTTLLPVAAAAPDTRAIAPAREATGALWVWVSTLQQLPDRRGPGLLPLALAAANMSGLAAQGSACSLRTPNTPGFMLVCRRMACLAVEYIAK